MKKQSHQVRFGLWRVVDGWEIRERVLNGELHARAVIQLKNEGRLEPETSESDLVFYVEFDRRALEFIVTVTQKEGILSPKEVEPDVHGPAESYE